MSNPYFACQAPYSNRQSYTIPDFANPYNAPQKPRYFRDSKGRVGSVTQTVAGTYGNCPSYNPTKAVCRGYDFVCPTASPCFSQTSQVVGWSPGEVCSRIQGYRYPNCRGSCNC